MHRCPSRVVTWIVSALVFSQSAFAASGAEGRSAPAKPAPESPGAARSASDIAEIINSLDYPELQVVPRASERLRIEAREEDDSWAYMHWPIEVSGLATLVTGFAGRSQLRETLSETQKNDAGNIATLTQAVGLTWVAAGVLIGLQRPYRSGLMSIARMGGKDERTTLLRERLAEEALERPARFMKPVQWVSVITNLSLSVLMGSFMTDQGRGIAGVSAALAFLPVVFEDPTVNIYEKHLEYKKKIYGPLTSTGFGIDPKSKTIYPTAMLTWQF